MNCIHCNAPCVKAGLARSGLQKYQCRSCNKYQQKVYRYKAYERKTRENIPRFMVEGLGIRSTARFLSISATTVIEGIRRTSAACVKPFHNLGNGTYEIDELWTYVGRKSNEVWVMYMIDRASKTVIDFRVGSRNR